MGPEAIGVERSHHIQHSHNLSMCPPFILFYKWVMLLCKGIACSLLGTLLHLGTFLSHPFYSFLCCVHLYKTNTYTKGFWSRRRRGNRLSCVGVPIGQSLGNETMYRMGACELPASIEPSCHTQPPTFRGAECGALFECHLCDNSRQSIPTMSQPPLVDCPPSRYKCTEP